MIRLKDFLTMMRLYNEDLDIRIDDYLGYEIDYDKIDKYMNKFINFIEFKGEYKKFGSGLTEIQYLGYNCYIKLHSENSSHEVFRNFIRYGDIKALFKNSPIPLIPTDTDGKWLPVTNIDDNKMVVVNLIPHFGFYSDSIPEMQIVLSDDAQIIHALMEN